MYDKVFALTLAGQDQYGTNLSQHIINSNIGSRLSAAVDRDLSDAYDIPVEENAYMMCILPSNTVLRQQQQQQQQPDRTTDLESCLRKYENTKYTKNVLA